MNTKPTAIVTGAGRGIGKACAAALADAGFNVLLNDLTADNEGQLVAGDVADLAQHAKLIQAAVDRFGRIDCLVNNAGVSVASRGDLLDVSEASFDNCIRVNTKAVFFLSQAVARHMLEQGELGGQHRSIINITSSNAVAVSINRAEYCVSKSASSMTTRLFGVRLAAEGIGVYEVRPGIIDTEMTRPSKEKYDVMVSESVPAGRWGSPDDVATVVRSMAEGRLRYTVGQAVTVDGGFTIPRF